MLRIAGLEVVYHSVARVISNLSLDVPDGTIVALLGPNGAGKTTTLRAITGLLPLHDGRITKGAVEWNGAQLAGLPTEAIVRRGLAQVMEGRRIFIELTVEENLRAGCFNHRGGGRDGGSAAIEEMYARFPRLAERRRQTAGLLSGGEQQTLAIARALLTRPKLLLLDEPSLGLSPRLTAEVADLIRRIRDQGVAVLLVEQNAQMALSLASHGYILENGRVVLDGPAAALRDDPDVKEFYLGMGGAGRRNYREVKRYARRKRWLS